MDYQDQINNFLNMQNLINAQQSVYLQKEQMTEEKAEAKEEEGGEDVGIAGLLGEFGVSNLKSFIGNYGQEQIKGLLNDLGLDDETAGNIGELIKGGLSKGNIDINDLKGLIPEDIKGLVPDNKALYEASKAMIPEDIKAIVPDNKALYQASKAMIPEDIKAPLSSSSLRSLNINTDNLDIGAMDAVEKNFFYRSIDKIGEGIKTRYASMRSQTVGEGETNDMINDLIFKNSSISDVDPLSIAGAPPSINLFSPSGEFLGNTLARQYNQEKIMKNLSDIAEDTKNAQPVEMAESLAPKLGAEDIAEGVGEKVGAEVAGEATADVVGAGLDLTGVLSPIGAVIGIGSAIYSAFKGVEDLFESHHTYTPPAPITTLFQAT